MGCAAREDRARSVNALAQTSLQAVELNAQCVDAYSANKIGKGSAEKWSAYTDEGIVKWAEGACVRYDVAIPKDYRGLERESSAKLQEMRDSWGPLCDVRARSRFAFPAAALAEPAARAFFAVLVDMWRARQETPEERDRWWQRAQETVERSCDRLRGLVPPVTK